MDLICICRDFKNYDFTSLHYYAYTSQDADCVLDLVKGDSLCVDPCWTQKAVRAWTRVGHLNSDIFCAYARRGPYINALHRTNAYIVSMLAGDSQL